MTKLLRSAGQAVQTLAASYSSDQTFSERKASFTSASTEYFTTLSSIDVRLRRQIYALEEADIVSPEAMAKETPANPNVLPALVGMGGAQGRDSAKQAKLDKASGGLGNLDVGWLNSRNDNVGKEMEAELWAKAREMVERYEKNRPSTQNDDGMEVDMEQEEVVLLRPWKTDGST